MKTGLLTQEAEKKVLKEFMSVDLNWWCHYSQVGNERNEKPAIDDN